MATPFEELIPHLEIAHNCILTSTGDCTLAYEVIKPVRFTLSSSDLDTLHERWMRAIRTLPVGTILHWQDWYTRARHHEHPERTDDSFLGEASERFFHERPHLEHTCYLFITRPYGTRKPPSSALSTLVRPTLMPDFIIHPGLLQEFMDQCEQFRCILNDSGLLTVNRLPAEGPEGKTGSLDLINLYFSLKKGPGALGLNDIRFQEDVVVDDRRLILFTLADAEHLPEQCSSGTRYDRYSTDRTEFSIGFATHVGPLLDAEHVYSQFIFLEDRETMRRHLDTRRRHLTSLSAYDRGNAAASEAIEAFLIEMATAHRSPVRAHFNVVAWSDGATTDSELKNKVTTAISRMGAVPHREIVGAPQIWWAGVPGNAGELPVNETFDTFLEQALCFLIAETNDQSSPGPCGIRLGDRLDGHPLHVDISDYPKEQKWIGNRNKFILGGSGSGKSFFTNHLVRTYYEHGAHTVLVDVGGSYRGLCDLLGGYYFTYTDSHPISFNPFWLPSGERPGVEKKESLKALLVALWKNSGEQLRRSEYVGLSNALQGYYIVMSKFPADFPCFDSFYDYLQNIYSRTLADEGVTSDQFDLADLLYALRPFYREGEYGHLLNAREQLDTLDQPLIVFELDNVKDHPVLFPAITIIIMDIFLYKMRRLQGIRKILLIEEAWKPIAKGMGEYIQWAFKTVRKFFGEAIVVTQEVEDIISSEVVKQAIINNSDCKILLDQSKFLNRFDDLQSLLGLSDKDKTLVLSLNKANEPGKNYKEVFIGFASGPSKVYRLEVSLEEYLTYTTEESEKVKVLSYAGQYGSMRTGIARLAADIRSGAVKLLIAAVFFLGGLLIPSQHASAQILEIIDEAAKKALIVADQQVQRLQNETLILQNAQQVVQNAMEQTHLDEITGWVQQQEDLYRDYYQELWQVKAVFTGFSKVKDLITRQVRLIRDTKLARTTIGQDPHFSAPELDRIDAVYSTFLDQSAKNIQQLGLVISAFATQMDDAARLRIIDGTGQQLDRDYNSLYQFTQQNLLLSLQRSKDEQDLRTIRLLYGIK